MKVEPFSAISACCRAVTELFSAILACCRAATELFSAISALLLCDYGVVSQLFQPYRYASRENSVILSHSSLPVMDYGVILCYSSLLSCSYGVVLNYFSLVAMLL